MSYQWLFLLAALTLTACGRTANSAGTLPDASQLDNSETAQRQNFGMEAAKLLSAQDYDGLEKLATTDRALESPFGNGTSPIVAFYDEISGTPDSASSQAFDQELAALNAWSSARPDSVTAKIAIAEATVSYAWFIRGSGDIDTVSQTTRMEFADKLDEAYKPLMSVAQQRAQYPDWYAAAETLGMGQTWSKEKFLGATDECTTKFPKFYESYSEAVIYLLPRWNGSFPEVVDFVTKSADQLGGDEGDMLYARLAQTLWSYSYDTNVFFHVGLSWPRVHHGMQLLCNRYPHSTLMFNYYCQLACVAQDRALARSLLEVLGDRYSEEVWSGKENFEQAKVWANDTHH